MTKSLPTYLSLVSTVWWSAENKENRSRSVIRSKRVASVPSRATKTGVPTYNLRGAANERTKRYFPPEPGV